MPISPLLQRFVEDELSRSAGLAERACVGTLAQLRQPRDGMHNATEREHYFELVEALQRQAAPFQREFCDTLRSMVTADLAGLAGEPEALPDTGGLQLMDESRVEADIEISRAAQLIDTAAEWELRELQTFTSTLAGQTHVSSESNPLRPLTYARALWQACGVVTPVAVQRAILLRTAAGVMSGQLKLAWAAACTRLESQGIEPGLYRTVVLTGAGNRPPTFDVTKPGALEDLLPTMPGVPADPVATPTAGAPARGTRAASSPAFEQALLKLEELLKSAPATPTAVDLVEHRATLMASTNATVDKQIVELLSRLFEAIFCDTELPPALRSVMARLQASALRVALNDPAMLATHDHPVWRLMNAVAAAGETYTQASDPRMAALLAFSESLVDGIARTGVPNAQPYQRAIERLDTFLGEQLQAQLANARSAVDNLQMAERREDLEQELSQRLADQMASLRTSATLRRFITGTWAKVLASTMLRVGDKAEPTVGYLKAVDELLWSLKLPDHPQSRQRLLGVLPGLLQRLRAGMTEIALPAADQQFVLDELMAVHTEALKPGKGAAASEPTPSEIVQRLRDEVIADEPPSRTPFSDSLIDLGSMETVPAELMLAHDVPPSGTPLRIDTLPAGGRYRLFLHGRWSRVQLLWRSPQGRFFLFAGEAAGRTHSVTLRALERLRDEDLFKPLEQATLIQRAVDDLMSKLTLVA